MNRNNFTPVKRQRSTLKRTATAPVGRQKAGRCKPASGLPPSFRVEKDKGLAPLRQTKATASQWGTEIFGQMIGPGLMDTLCVCVCVCVRERGGRRKGTEEEDKNNRTM